MKNLFTRVFYLAMIFIWSIIGILIFKSEFSTTANAQELTVSYYPLAGHIVGINEDDDTFVIETQDRRKLILREVEDWAIGDMCIMTMSDMSTPANVYDDVLVSVRYYHE